jgi:N-acyl-D-aspartate/D-glutamate deacylase
MPVAAEEKRLAVRQLASPRSIFRAVPSSGWIQMAVRVPSLRGVLAGRERRQVTVAEAVRKMTSLPASNLGIANRGQLEPGYFADIAVFDPATIQDHATFEKPRQLATGVSEVFVNGVEVVHNGVHTGTKPGRVVKRDRN